MVACYLPLVSGCVMREVEVKFRIHDPAALVAALKAHGIELGLPVEQDDQAYAPEGGARDGHRGSCTDAPSDRGDGLHAHSPDPQGPAVGHVR